MQLRTRRGSRRFPNLRVGFTPNGNPQSVCVDCTKPILTKVGYHGDLCDDCEEERAEEVEYGR